MGLAGAMPKCIGATQRNLGTGRRNRRWNAAASVRRGNALRR
jgi:hypothetical protein